MVSERLQIDDGCMESILGSCCTLLIPRCPYRPGGAALRVAEAVAETTEEVDDGLDPRQEHEHWAQHAAGHRHDRHRLHGLTFVCLMSYHFREIKPLLPRW